VKNFVGAKRALDEMQQFLSSQKHQRNLAQSLAVDGIKWSFIPPHSPHWGILFSLVYEILTFALLLYFGAASHFRDFLGLSVKTTTESIGHTRKCDKFNH